MTTIFAISVLWVKTRSRVWFWECVDWCMCWSKPIDSVMDKNVDLRGSPSLSMWILKSPTITTLSEFIGKLERKSANSSKKPLYGPGGLYTVTRIKLTAFLSGCAKLRTSTSKKLNFKPDFKLAWRLELYTAATPPPRPDRRGTWV